jgi:predicted nucleotidyltransferase
MYQRLNITLPADVLARADEFAQRERYTRSSLIAAALDSFVNRDPRLVVVAQGARDEYAIGDPELAGAVKVYAPEAVGLNPAVRPLVPAIIGACRRNGVIYAALVGSATRPDPAIVPRDLVVLVRFDPVRARLIQHRLALQTELEILTHKVVELIDMDAARDEHRRRELESTAAVIYDAESPDAESPDA